MKMKWIKSDSKGRITVLVVGFLLVAVRAGPGGFPFSNSLSSSLYTALPALRQLQHEEGIFPLNFIIDFITAGEEVRLLFPPSPSPPSLLFQRHHRWHPITMPKRKQNNISTTHFLFNGLQHRYAQRTEFELRLLKVSVSGSACTNMTPHIVLTFCPV